MSHEIEARLLCGWFERLRGLLGSDAETAGTVLLQPCRSIHTLGMAYPIDVAFLADDGSVLSAWRSLPPGRMLSCWKACGVLERPSSELPWPAAGQRCSLVVRVGNERQGEVEDGR